MKDIEKLEKLRCLKLSDEVKAKVADSLDDVMQMMASIQSIDTSSFSHPKEDKDTKFVNSDEKLFSRDEKIQGLHQEEKMFLAPKVITK